MTASIKHLIVRVFTKTYGLSLKMEAVHYLVSIFDKEDIDQTEIKETLEWIAASYLKQEGKSDPLDEWILFFFLPVSL